MRKDIRGSGEMNIPDHHYKTLARCLLPKMQSYFESEEGMKDLKKYRSRKNKQVKTGRE